MSTSFLRSISRWVIAWLVAGSLVHTASGQTTVFTYQGRLNDKGTPANGTYDVTFSVYDAAANGNLVAGPIALAPLSITDGVFTVQLDFGSSVFTGANRWLELGVRTNGSASPHALLTPRQPVTSTPYALQALTAGTAATASTANSVAAANVTGKMLLGQLPAEVVANGAGGVALAGNFAGTFTGNGAALTNLQASNLNGALSAGQIPNLDAAKITSGVLSDSRLSGNVALLTGNAAFAGTVSAARFNGNGTGITHLDLTKADAKGALNWSFTNVFAAAGHFSVGNGPRAVVLVDIKGDGKIAVVTANNDASSVTVLGNDGQGILTSNGNTGVGTSPNGIASADVNGDGRPDLITANYSTDSLTVLTNNGSGGFAFSANVPAGWGPVSVAVADMNGDGRPDLIAANITLGSLTVLTNNGSGGFATMTTNAVGRLPRFVIAVDVNGDGRADLVSANQDDNSISVVTNGVAGLALAGTYNVGSLPHYLAGVDVNGDGWVDLVSANQGDNTLTVLTNNAAGGFVIATNLVVNGGPRSVIGLDVNGDKWPDLICASPSTSLVSVFTNKHSGGFALMQTFSVGSAPYAIAGGDLNGDGWPDLITADYGAHTVTVYTNRVFWHADYAGSFGGNGAGLTNLSATGIAGNLALSQLPATLVTNGASGVNFSGAFSGSGLGMTNVMFSSLVYPDPYLIKIWGNAYTPTNVPPGLSNVAQIARGVYFTTAIKTDGTVVVWNDTQGYGMTNVPPAATNVVKIASGEVCCFVVALKGDGSVVVWGYNGQGQTNVPPGLIATDVAAGFYHILALKPDGTVVGWGDNSSQSLNIPSGLTNVVGVAATYHDSFALKSDGTVVGWGSGGLKTIPADFTNVVKLVGGGFLLGLRSDGTVACMGTQPPPGLTNVVDIASGEDIGVALKSDGTVVTWGRDIGVPAGIKATKIAAGGLSVMTLSQPLMSPPVVLNGDNGVALSGTFSGAFSGNGNGLTNLNLAGGRVNNADIYLRSGSDRNHGLGWYGVGKLFGGTVIDGPVLYGWSGGALGTANNTTNIALQWDGSTNVTVRGNLAVGGAVTAYGPLSVSTKGLGIVAQFGNAAEYVANVTTNGTFNGLAFNATSDRNAKENFKRLDTVEVLEKVVALPITRWNYKVDAGTTHIGPVAQDFSAAFGVGTDDRHIATVDADGVALAAIQGLNEKLAAELKRRDAENAELKARLEKLEQLLNRQLNGGRP